jgi:hypothetical protein
MVVLCTTLLAFWPADANAQRPGHPVGGGRGAVVVASPFYFGYGYYDPFWWGYGGWYPYGWYGPYFPPSGYYSNVGSARLQVKPRNAEVYVDGYLAGTVDNFDGFSQRLDVDPGEHELTIYLDGYRTVTEHVLFRRGATLNIKHTMQQLPAGESTGPRPQGAGRSERQAPGRTAAIHPPESRDDRQERTFGSLSIRVQPKDAAIYVDGQEWSASEGSGPMLIELGEGNHEVEVRKDGFTTFRRSVRIRAGETVPLNVSLSK